MKLDEKRVFLLIQTQIQSDNLCRQLVRTEKPSSSTQASTTSILHSKERSQRQWRAWEINIKSSIKKDKGMQTQAYGNGAKFCYSFLTLQVSPPPKLQNGSIYSPQMGNGESNQIVSKHMEDQGSSYSLLDEENYKYFLF